MISHILTSAQQMVHALTVTPQRRYMVRIAEEAGASGKIRVIVYLSSVSMHFNFVRDLIERIASDQRFSVLISGLFPLDTIVLPDSCIRIPDVSMIRAIPAEFLMTMDAGMPIPHHPMTKVIHVPHSLASMHVIYPDGAFDHFDGIFCAGPHHLHELRELRSKRNITGCVLIPTGYEIVDRLARTSRHHQGILPTILFAPSWGPDNALSLHGQEIVATLIGNYRVIVRPHVMSLREDPGKIQSLIDAFGDNHRFTLDLNPDSSPSLTQADLIISDWSGIAFEYALAFLRPVLFIDGPMKVFNPQWTNYLKEPGIECTARESVGRVLSDISHLNTRVEQILSESPMWEEKIMRARENLLYHFGKCADTSHHSLIALYEQKPETDWVMA